MGRPRVALNGQLGSCGRQMCLLLSPSSGSSCTAHVSHLFQPPGGVPGTQPLLPNSMDPTRQQGTVSKLVSAWGMGSPKGLLLLLLSTPASATHSSPILSRRAPQHGRIDAENEPSPRHGAHGSWPTGKPICMSISLASYVPPPSLLFPQSVSLSTSLSRRGKRKGRD